VRDADAEGSTEDHELALNVHQQRRFLGMADDEPTELTFFHHGKISIAHATTAESHCVLLKQGQGRRNFNGAYQLMNGPINPQVFARYRPDTIEPAWNGRATDKEIETRRVLFTDIDPARIKGISATDSEKEAAREVAHAVHEYLGGIVGPSALAFGDSGNGFFVLVAIEPCAPTPESTTRIARFADLLNKRFATDRVKIDRGVWNPARLMAACGTWKRKGFSTPERPHRLTSFRCPATVTRVPLECLA
jgi:hypothetical protein